MRILRASEYRSMPWKNGGGVTTEIAVSPAGAGLDTFDWRVSMASVETDGPFSLFPGIDRTLSILSGHGMRLEGTGFPAAELTVASEPFAFGADIPVEATLRDGSITDLNVMSRRARYRHTVRRMPIRPRVSFRTSGAHCLLVCIGGETVLFHQGGEVPLGDRDALLVAGGVSFNAESRQAPTLFVIGFELAGPEN